MAQEAERIVDEVGEKTGVANGGPGGSLVSALTSKELLIPAALSAAGAVAVAKGPDLVRKVAEATQDKGEDEAERFGEKALEGAKKGLTGGSGGVAGLAGKAVSKVTGGGGGGGSKKTRRLTIQRWTDVAVPVETAYEEWTDFDEYPKFMHRVLSVRKEGRDKVRWQEKIWFSRRQWEGRITERRKNDRIAWKTTSGMSHYGVVSFHKLDDRLTRVMVTMEFEPTGMVEKMASGLRFVKRAVQADLARFKSYAEFKDAKGLEYGASSGSSDEKGRDENARQRSSSQGAGQSDGDRSAERREREQRREERRQAVAR